jgi:hypothetical protein
MSELELANSQEIDLNQSPIRYANWSVTLGLIVAALFGWFGNTAIDFGVPQLELWLSRVNGAKDSALPSVEQLKSILSLYAIVGIPFAIAVTLLVGFPMWRGMEARGQTSMNDCVKVGAKAGFGIWLVGFVFSLIFGIGAAIDPNSSYGHSQWGLETVVDGVPTLFGLFLQSLRSVSCTLIGAVSGYLAWRVTVFEKGNR